MDENLIKLDAILQRSIEPDEDFAYISIAGYLILITDGESKRYKLERIW